MSQLRIQCPGCKRYLRIASRLVGKRIRCPEVSCSRQIVVRSVLSATAEETDEERSFRILGGGLSGPSVPREMIERLASENPDVRRQAVVAVAAIGGPKAGGLLVRALWSEENYDVRKSLIGAAVSLREPQAIVPIARMAHEAYVKSREWHPQLSVYADLLEALRSIISRAGVRELDGETLELLASLPFESGTLTMNDVGPRGEDWEYGRVEYSVGAPDLCNRARKEIARRGQESGPG